MNGSISRDLSRIARGAEKLNAQADALTKQVTDLSAHLQELQVGVACFYTAEKHEARAENADGCSVPCSYYLGFSKDDNGKWGIVVLCKAPKTGGGGGVEGSDQTETVWVRPFESCARDIRLALAGYAPQLLSGLATAVENVASSVEASLTRLKEMQQELPQALAKSRK